MGSNRPKLRWPVVFLTALAVCVNSRSLQSTPVCSPGEQSALVLDHNATVGLTLRTLSTVSFSECSDHCSTSPDCHGVLYTVAKCDIFGVGKEQAPEGSKILRKNCVKSERICSSPFHFDAFEQKILVGFAREVVPADNIQICMENCLNSFDTFGFECESLMYYPTDKECILNTEDRLDRPDLFTDEVEDTVTYMDNNCAGSQCYAPYITQYISVEGKQLENELDRIINVDLDSCQSLCTQRLSVSANDFNCKSFMYNNVTRTCILSDERSTPMGRGSLVSTPGFTYYEKKCFASPNTCRNIPSFIRVPQKILVGFAAFVMENVPSVTMCLDQCTNPPPETGDDFACKSVMYYYNEQECILNAEDRYSKPDLFIAEGDEFLVDYFDITCHLESEKCAPGSHLKAVRTINAALPEGDGSLHVIKNEGSGVQECMKKCFEMAPEKCRSFNFDKKSQTCDLLYLDGQTNLKPQIRHGTDLYDLHCLAVEAECSTQKTDALFSRYPHTKQKGIPSKTYKIVSLNSCLEVCAGNPTCAGVNYNRRIGHCDIFDGIDDSSDSNEYVDFYKNLCVVKEEDLSVSAAAHVPAPNHRVSGTVTGKDNSKSHLSVNKKVKPFIKEQEHRRAPESALPVGPPVSVPAQAIQTLCNYDGIKVQINHKEQFSGVVFVKNRYDTCRKEIINSNGATLNLGLPKDFGMKPIIIGDDELQAKPEFQGKQSLEDFKRAKRQALRECGIIDMLNGTYKATVVIQTNNLGIPGLVTSMDQLYEVSCDYSSMLGGKFKAGFNMTVIGPEPNLIKPKGKIELGNPVFMQLLGEAGQPIISANIGDSLQLRFEIMAMEDELDFFVRKCHAYPGGTSAETGDKLQLFDGGCPTLAAAQKQLAGPVEVLNKKVKFARLQAFRFDSSSAINITCELDLCKGKCSKVDCSLNETTKQTIGRKKRMSEYSDGEYKSSRSKYPRHMQSTVSLVVNDPFSSRRSRSVRS
ncbi:unnamed protein product [Auanema sp. JU1783]|nr:unnamed protein product [Auanema sp. JU1783]